MDNNPFNISSGTKTPFDATPAGIAVNTVTGLPKAALTVAKDTGQAIARDFFGVGMSLGNVINRILGRDITTEYTPTNAVSQAILGEKTNDLATRVINAEQAIKDSPLAQKFGLDKHAGPLAFGGVIGSVALDFTPGGGEENVAKQLLKTTTEEAAARILTKASIPEKVVTQFAPKFAEATKPEEVNGLIDLLKNAVGAHNVSQEIDRVAQTSPKTFSEFHPDDQKFLSNYADKVTGGEGVPLRDTQIVKETLQKAGFHAPEDPKEIASVINTAQESAFGKDITNSLSTPQLSQTQRPTILRTLEGPQIGPKPTVLESVSSGGSIPPKPPVNNILDLRPQPEGDPIAAFTKALQDAKPIRAKQEQLYTTTRAQRITDVQKVAQETSGEAGFYAEKAKLAGEMPKVEYESLRNTMSQDQIDSIFNAVKDSQNLDSFEKITARQGLAKMFGLNGGSVPTEGEIKLLSRVFPKETIDTMLSKRPLLTKIGEGAINILNVPRAIMSSADMSAPFRQGLFFVGRPEFWKSFGQMFKDFASENMFKAAQEDIFRRPTYPMMKDAKLAIMDDGSQLSGREEKFMSNIAERIPGIGRIVRASSRAYTGFLNKVRADVFDSLLNQAKDANVPVTEKLVTDLGKYINSATGRGSIGSLNRAAEVLNSLMFSPRLMMSRLNLLNPQYYVKLDPFVRKEAIKDLFKFTSLAGTMLTLGSLGGATVNLDPTNSDFLKMKFGNTRLDILGGFQQYIRLGAQLLTGKITSSTTGKTLTLGEGYKPLTRLDILVRFLQGKENPVASFVTDWLQGQNLVGDKFTLGNEIANRFTPMILQDLSDVYKDGGFWKALGTWGLGTFGVGTQTYGNTPQGKIPVNPFNQ